jgi:hypothetical protein
MTIALNGEITRGAARGRQWLQENKLPYSDEITLRASGERCVPVAV